MRKLLYIPLLLFLYACPFNDDCEDPIPESRLDDDFRSYFDFKPGTYWIYEDSLTGEQDSVFIISNSSEFKEGDKGNYCDDRYNFETISISTFNGDTIENFVASTTLAGSGYQYYSSKLIGLVIYKVKSLATPSRQNIYLTNSRDSLTINNTTYRNIISVAKPLIDETGYPSDTIYLDWASNIGIIRKKNTNGKTLKLKRFSIIN